MWTVPSTTTASAREKVSAIEKPENASASMVGQERAANELSARTTAEAMAAASSSRIFRWAAFLEITGMVPTRQHPVYSRR